MRASTLQREAAAPPPAAIVEASLRDAGVLIAGVPALSRVLIEAARAGIREARVTIAEPEGLARVVADDLHRAGAELRVTWVGGLRAAASADPEASVLVLSRRWIAAASALRRLIAEGPAAALWDGACVAAALGPASAIEDLAASLAGAPAAGLRVDAQDGELVDLADPGAASARILRGTGKAADGLISRKLNRPISRWISARLLRLRWIRPGHMTVVTALFGLAMFIELVLGGRAGLLWGPILFQAASVVDGIDGEISRATFRTSRRGAALDTAVDMATNLAFLVGVTIGLTRVHGPKYLMISGVDCALFLLGLAVMTFLARRNPAGASFDFVKEFYAERCVAGVPALIYQALRPVFSRDLFAFAFAVIALAGLTWTIPFMFGLAAVLWLVLIGAAAPTLMGWGAGWPAPPAEAVGKAQVMGGRPSRPARARSADAS